MSLVQKMDGWVPKDTPFQAQAPALASMLSTHHPDYVTAGRRERQAKPERVIDVDVLEKRGRNSVASAWPSAFLSVSRAGQVRVLNWT